MKKVFLGLLLAFMLLLNGAHAWAMDADEAEQKAKEINDLAASDVIYSQEAGKALYYQNIQMIDLLKEIRDLLKENLDRNANKPQV